MKTLDYPFAFDAVSRQRQTGRGFVIRWLWLSLIFLATSAPPSFGTSGSVAVVNTSGCCIDIEVLQSCYPPDSFPMGTCNSGHGLGAGQSWAPGGNAYCPGAIVHATLNGCGGNGNPVTITVPPSGGTNVTIGNGGTPVYGSGGGGNTSFELPTPLNTSGSPMWYGLTDNGQQTGIVGLVQPGQSGTLYWTAPLGNTDSWGIQAFPVVGGVSTTSGSPGQQFPWGTMWDGTYFNQDGSGVTGPIIDGTPIQFNPGSTPPAPGVITYPERNADGSWKNLDPSTGIPGPGPAGTNLTINPDSTNGYVIIGGTTNTGGLDKGSYIGGVDALVKADSLDTAGIINAINQVDADARAFEKANHTDLTGVNGNLVSIFNVLSNGFGGLTNDTRLHGDLTNLLATDQDISTNLAAIAALLTNGPPTNAFDASDATNTAFASAQASYAGITALEGALNPGSSGLGSGGGSMSLSWGGFTVDVNPMHLQGMADVAAWIRGAFTFLMAVFCFRDAWLAVEGYLKASGSVRQASTAGDAVLGNNLNLISAQAMAIAITGVLAALPALFITWLGTTNYVATISSGLVGDAPGPVASGLSLVNSFLPVDYIVTGYVGVLVFRMQVGGLWWVVSTAVRHLTGA